MHSIFFVKFPLMYYMNVATPTASVYILAFEIALARKVAQELALPLCFARQVLKTAFLCFIRRSNPRFL